MQREQVPLGVGLASPDVVDGYQDRERVTDARKLQNRFDLLPSRARDDPEHGSFGGPAHGGPRLLAHGRPVGELAIPGGLAPQERRIVAAEPHADDLRVGEPCKLLVVLLLGERLSGLLEELLEDLAEKRLVLGQRPVEVEEQRVHRSSLGSRWWTPSRLPPESGPAAGSSWSRSAAGSRTTTSRLP